VVTINPPPTGGGGGSAPANIFDKKTNNEQRPSSSSSSSSSNGADNVVVTFNPPPAAGKTPNPSTKSSGFKRKWLENKDTSKELGNLNDEKEDVDLRVVTINPAASAATATADPGGLLLPRNNNNNNNINNDGGIISPEDCQEMIKAAGYELYGYDDFFDCSYPTAIDWGSANNEGSGGGASRRILLQSRHVISVAIVVLLATHLCYY